MTVLTARDKRTTARVGTVSSEDEDGRRARCAGDEGKRTGGGGGETSTESALTEYLHIGMR